MAKSTPQRPYIVEAAYIDGAEPWYPAKHRTRSFATLSAACAYAKWGGYGMSLRLAIVRERTGTPLAIWRDYKWQWREDGCYYA
jgi:hypothetical protein